MTAIPKRNDIMSRIERLERLVSDLTRPNLTAPLNEGENAEVASAPDETLGEESPA